MKLLTHIMPRRDGTVIHREGETVYTFEPDAAGDLVCEVADEAVVKKLLLVEGLFQPYDETDFPMAEALLAAAAADDADEDEDEDGKIDEDDDEPANPGALPLEANTPPKRRPGRPKKA